MKNEVALWGAVLGLAVSDILGPRVSGVKRPQWTKARRSARKWLFENGEEPGSCRWVCDFLGLDIDALRSEIKRLENGSESERHRFVKQVGHYGKLVSKRPSQMVRHRLVVR